MVSLFPDLDAVDSETFVEITSMESIPPRPLVPLAPLQLTEADLQLGEAEIGSYVDRVRRKVARDHGERILQLACAATEPGRDWRRRALKPGFFLPEA